MLNSNSCSKEEDGPAATKFDLTTSLQTPGCQEFGRTKNCTRCQIKRFLICFAQRVSLNIRFWLMSLINVSIYVTEILLTLPCSFLYWVSKQLSDRAKNLHACCLWSNCVLTVIRQTALNVFSFTTVNDLKHLLTKRKPINVEMIFVSWSKYYLSIK